MLKNAFVGPNKKWSCSDESKVQLFLAFKCFCISYVGLHYLDNGEVFDFNIKKGHEDSLVRINQITAIYNGQLAIPVEATYVILSTLAALIVFAIVKQYVDFAYFLFSMTKQEGLVEQEAKIDKRSLTLKAQMNFVLPVVACLMYVKPLSKDLLVPDLLTPHQFELLKTFIVLVIISLKALDFRQQVQFKLNESYLYIEKFMLDVNRKLFDYVRYRMSHNFLETWFVVF